MDFYLQTKLERIGFFDNMRDSGVIDIQEQSLFGLSSAIKAISEQTKNHNISTALIMQEDALYVAAKNLDSGQLTLYSFDILYLDLGQEIRVLEGGFSLGEHEGLILNSGLKQLKCLDYIFDFELKKGIKNIAAKLDKSAFYRELKKYLAELQHPVKYFTSSEKAHIHFSSSFNEQDIDALSKSRIVLDHQQRYFRMLFDDNGYMQLVFPQSSEYMGEQMGADKAKEIVTGEELSLKRIIIPNIKKGKVHFWFQNTQPDINSLRPAPKHNPDKRMPCDVFFKSTNYDGDLSITYLASKGNIIVSDRYGQEYVAGRDFSQEYKYPSGQALYDKQLFYFFSKKNRGYQKVLNDETGRYYYNDLFIQIPEGDTQLTFRMDHKPDLQIHNHAAVDLSQVRCVVYVDGKELNYIDLSELVHGTDDSEQNSLIIRAEHPIKYFVSSAGEIVEGVTFKVDAQSLIPELIYFPEAMKKHMRVEPPKYEEYNYYKLPMLKRSAHNDDSQAVSPAKFITEWSPLIDSWTSADILKKSYHQDVAFNMLDIHSQSSDKYYQRIDLTFAK